MPLFRGKLVLLGQDRPSNNRLKTALMGLQIDQFIECNANCKINSKGHWNYNVEESQTKSYMINLEDDYERAIARNIAVEIIKNRQNVKRNLSRNAKGCKNSKSTRLRTLEGKNKNRVAPTSDFKERFSSTKPSASFL